MLTQLTKLRSWQWLACGLATGLLGAASVRMWGDPPLSSFGTTINGRREFEEALVRDEGGRRRFTQLAVHADEVQGDGGERRKVHIVTGMYFDGRVSEGPGARPGPVWRPAFYVAEVPYRPFTPARRSAFGSAETSRPEAIQASTVIDFLNAMEGRGVRFSRAWWRSPDNARWAWLLSGALGVGILWPATLNLMVFGSLRRPREKSLDLRHLAQAGRETDRDATDKASALQALDKVVAGLSQPTAPAPPSVSTPAGIPAERAIPSLQAMPLEPIPSALHEAPETAFAAQPEDFYPTELKARTEK